MKTSESTTKANLQRRDNSFPPPSTNSAIVNIVVIDSITENDCSLCRSKYNKSRPVKKSLRCLKQLTPNNLFSVNRYAPLSKVQEEEHQMTCNKRNSYLSSSRNHTKQKPKVILLGDSHIRGCSEKLSNLLGNSFIVSGYTKPSANASDTVNSIDLKSEQLSKKDTVIFCGGTRDIARNNSKLGLSHISLC